MTTEIEERRRKQAIKVIITETGMLAVIIVLVIFLVMLSLGYNFNLGGGVETSGLVQINSIPTGAAITVDGEGMFLPTNQSKTMASGVHTVELKKDGYTSWSKDLAVREGMLYRLYYPRLYLEERKKEVVIKAPQPSTEGEEAEEVVPKAIVAASVSKDRKYLLHIYNDGEWGLIGLNDGEPKMKAVAVAEVVPANASIEVLEWAKNGSKVLVKACTETCDVVLVNLNEVAKSLNLTQEFALDFSEIKMASDSADLLVAVADGKLRQINVTDVEISKVMAEGVESFSNHNAKIVFVKDGAAYLYDDEKPVKLYAAEGGLRVKLSEYYSEDYLTIISGAEMKVFYGRLPKYNEKFSKTMKELATLQLSFTPSTVEVRGGGELVVAATGAQVAVMDAESYEIKEYTTESEVRWLSDFDIYTVKEGWLTARDFDNANPHALIAEFDDRFPAAISENGRYIYYYLNNNLVRENIK